MDERTAPPAPPQSFAYEACDIPAGLTIREFRAQRASPRPRRRTSLLRRLSRVLRAGRRSARPSHH